jgi:hypothetical protein
MVFLFLMFYNKGSSTLLNFFLSEGGSMGIGSLGSSDVGNVQTK